MSIFTRIKQPIKEIRWRMRRSAAARRFGSEQLNRLPIVIGNAMPKSGSHLLHQVLLGLTHLGPFVDPGMPPLSRSAENINLSEQAVLAKLDTLQAGDIVYAYLQAKTGYIKALRAPNVAAFFIHRDPRDVLVSHVFYATDIYPGHGMHKYYKKLASLEARINAAITGVDEDDFHLSPIKAKYDKYFAWFSETKVHTLSYEGLILERDKTIEGMLAHLENYGFSSGMNMNRAISFLSQSVRPNRSGTFRKGQVGDWKQHFTNENKALFKEKCGDLLTKLGYERNDNW